MAGERRFFESGAEQDAGKRDVARLQLQARTVFKGERKVIRVLTTANVKVLVGLIANAQVMLESGVLTDDVCGHRSENVTDVRH